MTRLLDTLEFHPVLDGTFQANPDYELVQFDRLPADQQELFLNLTRDPDFYGILLPRESGSLSLKSVCRDTALLFMKMREPGKLPLETMEATEETRRSIAQLVLDGVLLMEREGRMVHGADALDVLCDSEPGGAAPETRIGVLSIQALKYAQSLPVTDAASLSNRLYMYGRIPDSAHWRERFPGEESVRRVLSLPIRDEVWQELPRDPENDGWIAWRSRACSPQGETGRNYKLYVSPRPEWMGEAFTAVITALKPEAVKAFKVGRDRTGILRPDKLVIYFSDFDQVEQAAAQILSKLSGCPAQGVPFSAELGDPLVSWGIDPVTADDLPPWLSRQSWRLWVTNRLAAALVTAKRDRGSPIEPWKYALERLKLDSVNTTTWTISSEGA